MITNNKDIEQVDIIIKTIERYDCLEKLLLSIVKYYKNAKISIADDSRHVDDSFYKKIFSVMEAEGLEYTPKIFKLDYDSGLSCGRNHLVKNTNNPYLLLLDDDFVFTEKTKIENFLKVIQQSSDIGVVGGLLMDKNKNECHYEFNWEFKDGVLSKKNDMNNWIEFDNIRYKYTQAILNFCLFRREVFSDVSWNPIYKICGEHDDFLLNLNKTKWKITYTDAVVIDHATTDVFTDFKKGGRVTNYSKLRRRVKYRKMFFKKNGIKQLIQLDGSIETPGSILLIYHYKLLLRRVFEKIRKLIF